MACEPGPDFVGSAVKEKGNEPSMSKKLFDRCLQWPKLQRIAILQRRWQRPVFGPRVKVACTKNNSAETADVQRIERRTSRQSHFDLPATWLMHARETGRQGCGIVGYQQIAGTKKVDERRTRSVNDVSLRINY